MTTLLLLLTVAVPAHACQELRAESAAISHSISEQANALQRLRAGISAMETSCRERQATIARKGAQNAKAESCVALRESAAMNRDLTQTSEACVTKVEAIRQQVDHLRVRYVAPAAEGLAFSAHLDRQLPSLQRYCRAEVGKTRELLERAQELHQATVASVTRATESIASYTTLGNQTRQFQETSQAAAGRCRSDTDAAPLQAAARERRGSGAPAAAPRSGKSPHSASMITGELKNETLPSAGRAPASR